MNRWRRLLLGATGGFAAASSAFAQAKPASARPASATGPRFEVEMLWPKPMPNRWILGSVTGVAVDARDHIFVLSIPDYFTARTEIGSGTNPPTGECCTPVPAVVEYDADGTLVGHWGGPGAGYDWPVTPSGIAIDPKGDIWIGGSGSTDTRLLKFSHDGKFIMQVGKAVAVASATPAGTAAADTAYAGVSRAAAAAAAGGGRGRGGRGGRGRTSGPSLPANNASLDAFGGPTSISFDAATNEAFVADGSRNRRVAVIDMTTGEIKRAFGAYGNRPEDGAQPAYTAGSSPKQFGTPVACAEVSKDGMVYVCDRANDRVQVFKKDGSFVKEQGVGSATLGAGSVWDVAFSADPQQKYLYVADGMNEKIWILDRATLNVISTVGDGGRQPGQFYAVHSIATDSKGNIYTGETLEGKRLQKFTFKGVGAVPANAGTAWPRAAAKSGGAK